MGTTPISALSPQVLARIEELGPPVFWNQTTEIYSAIIEAMSDLLILVGRPNFTINQLFTLVPNTVWQSVPKGKLLITDIQGQSSPLWRVSLFDMDYVQTSWGPDWESDTANLPTRWGPVGFSTFFVHPAPTTAIQVTITSIAYPTTDLWPYTGTETVPFHDEFFEAIEQYAAHYLRIKEFGLEFQESLELYKAYLSLAERMTQIESRKDPLVFSKTFGGPTGLNPIRKR
jgi:hypothetical protein